MFKTSARPRSRRTNGSPIACLAALFASLCSAIGWCSSGPEVLSPLKPVVDPSGEHLYLTCATAPGIVVVDAGTAEVARVLSLPAPASGLAFSPEGERLYATCGEPVGRVLVLDPASGELIAEHRIGSAPCSPQVSPDGRTLWICDRFDHSVRAMDTADGSERARIGAAREPVAGALTPDGELLLVANLLPAGSSDGDYVSAEVTAIATAEGRVAARIRLPNGSTGLRDLCVSPDGQYAFATHILARYHLPTTQLERGWMNTNALSIIDVERRELLNTILLDDVDRGAANPWGVAVDAEGARLLVAHAGSHELSVIDLAGVLEVLLGMEEAVAAEVPNDLSFLARLRRRIATTGRGPRGLAVVAGRAFAAEYFSDSLGVIDLDPEAYRPASSIPLGAAEVTPSLARRGEMLFHDASLCFQQWQSCSSCHPDGRVDGLNWDLLNDGIGNPKNTKSLLLAHSTPPAMSTGARDTAEVAVRSGIRHIQFSVRPEEDAVAIDAYLRAMQPTRRGGGDDAAVRRGGEVFEKAGCAVCHPPPLYTDLKQYDLGLGAGLDREQAFDTPTLIEAWRTGPWLHDGRSSSLREVLTVHNPEGRHGSTAELGEAELDDLVAFLRSL